MESGFTIVIIVKTAELVFAVGKKSLKASNGEIGAYKKADQSLHKLKRDWPLIWDRSRDLVVYSCVAATVILVGILALRSIYGLKFDFGILMFTTLAGFIASIGNRAMEKSGAWSIRNHVLRLSRMLQGQTLKEPFGSIAGKKFKRVADEDDTDIRKDTASDMLSRSELLEARAESLATRPLMIEAVIDRLLGKKPKGSK